MIRALLLPLALVTLFSTAAAEEAGTGLLLDQGIDPSAIFEPDGSGLPVVCGTEAAAVASAPAMRAAAPPNMIGWEAVPGVIRADGSETFRLEVSAGIDVQSVTLETAWPAIVLSGPLPLALLDDGAGADRAPGDGIYTAGPFGFSPSNHFFAPTYMFDSESPAGIDTTGIGTVRIGVDGGSHEFLLPPAIGLVRADIAPVPSISLSASVKVSAHLVNIRGANGETQRFMRQIAGGPTGLAQTLYNRVPDVFDFLVFFSTYKLEQLPQTAGANFIAGIHSQVKTDYTGTGLGAQNSTALYGSAGRLLSVNALDAYERGVVSNNLVHEIIHQWACFLAPSLGVCDGAHYKTRSSAGSLVGGFAWADNGDSTFSALCEEGRSGAHRAGTIDLYLAGLLAGAVTPPVRAYHESLSVTAKCQGQPIQAGEIVATATATDIEAQHGAREPGPASARRDFHIGFVAESIDRLLTPTEMTFYEILARHATLPLAEADDDPYLGFNWVPIERFLGENTTWTSEVCLLDGDADGRCDGSQCLRGDCNGNGELDAGDPICTVRCLLGQPAPGIDCTCVSDCNCVSGIEAGDPVCSVQRLIGSFPETACGRVP